jgi:hypothetical protein
VLSGSALSLLPFMFRFSRSTSCVNVPAGISVMMLKEMSLCSVAARLNVSTTVALPRQYGEDTHTGTDGTYSIRSDATVETAATGKTVIMLRAKTLQTHTAGG